jgi:hypothetical protein
VLGAPGAVLKKHEVGPAQAAEGSVHRTSADDFFLLNVTTSSFCISQHLLSSFRRRSWDMGSGYLFTISLALFTYVVYLPIRLSIIADGWNWRLQVDLLLHTAGKDI